MMHITCIIQLIGYFLIIPLYWKVVIIFL